MRGELPVARSMERRVARAAREGAAGAEGGAVGEELEGLVVAAVVAAADEDGGPGGGVHLVEAAAVKDTDGVERAGGAEGEGLEVGAAGVADGGVDAGGQVDGGEPVDGRG